MWLLLWADCQQLKTNILSLFHILTENSTFIPPVKYLLSEETISVLCVSPNVHLNFCKDTSTALQTVLRPTVMYDCVIQGEWARVQRLRVKTGINTRLPFMLLLWVSPAWKPLSLPAIALLSCVLPSNCVCGFFMVLGRAKLKASVK